MVKSVSSAKCPALAAGDWLVVPRLLAVATVVIFGVFAMTAFTGPAQANEAEGYDILAWSDSFDTTVQSGNERALDPSSAIAWDVSVDLGGGGLGGGSIGFVPEPSRVLLQVLGAALIVFRRRRGSWF